MSKKPTRLQHGHFLVGQEQPDLGTEAKIGKLPTTRSVLQYFFFRKNLAKFKFKPVGPAICCPFKSHTFVPDCENGCLDISDAGQVPGCLVRKLKTDGNWLASGIRLISDVSIIRKVIKLNDEYKVINKNKRKPNSENRATFLKKLDALFDISAPEAEDTIDMDRLRSENDKVEDLVFLSDQRDPNRRKMVVGERDVDYDQGVSDRNFLFVKMKNQGCSKLLKIMRNW